MKKRILGVVVFCSLFSGCVTSGALRGAPGPVKAATVAAYIGILSVYGPLQYGHYHTRPGTIAIINESSYPVSVGVVTRFGKMIPLKSGEQQWFRCDISGSIEVEAIARATMPSGIRTATTNVRLSSWGGKRSFVWVVRDEDFGIPRASPSHS